jgi:muramidase (phage lysozyme)
MAEYAEKARHYGVINERAAEVAEEFARQQHALGLATEGLTNAIGEALAPVLGPMLHDMAEWIADNRAWIATDIAKAVRDFAGDVLYLAGQFGNAYTGAMTLAAYFAGPWLAAMMLGLGPVTAAIAAIVAGIALVHAGREVGNPENLPANSPLWAGVPEKEQLNYRTSPASRKSMGRGNPNPFHWWNPGSWLGREDHLPPLQPAFDPNAPNGVPRTGRVFGPQTPRADVTMDPTRRGFLATLAGPESGGAYDIRNGGARFSDYSHFPEGIGRGGTSTAAGAYQFTAETWKEEAARLGLPDITPANQDKAAWDLAERRYRAKTGRDLETDLKAGNQQAQIAAALGPTWPSLPGGSRSHQSQDQFDAALARNTTAAADQPVNVASAPPANIAGGTGASPTEVNHTVTGDANLRITLGGAVPEGTMLGANTTGDLWGSPPRVERAMSGVPG